jgi:hypothetical protein
MWRRCRRWLTSTAIGRWTLILGLYLLRWVGWKTALTDGWWGRFATYLQREWRFFAFHLQTFQRRGEEDVRHTVIGACVILIHFTTKRTLSQALTSWKMFPHKKLPLLVKVFNKKQTEALLTASLLASQPTRVAQHASLGSLCGIIRTNSVDDISDEEIQEELFEHTTWRGYKLIRIQYHLRTSFLKFEVPTLRSVMRLGYERAPVELYTPNLMRCFRCQRFGLAEQWCSDTHRVLSVIFAEWLVAVRSHIPNHSTALDGIRRVTRTGHFLDEKGTQEVEPKNAFLSGGRKKSLVPKPWPGLTAELFVSREELMGQPRLQQHPAKAHWTQTRTTTEGCSFTQWLRPTHTNWLVVICMVQTCPCQSPVQNTDIGTLDSWHFRRSSCQ